MKRVKFNDVSVVCMCFGIYDAFSGKSVITCHNLDELLIRRIMIFFSLCPKKKFISLESNIKRQNETNSHTQRDHSLRDENN